MIVTDITVCRRRFGKIVNVRRAEKIQTPFRRINRGIAHVLVLIEIWCHNPVDHIVQTRLGDGPIHYAGSYISPKK